MNKLSTFFLFLVLLVGCAKPEKINYSGVVVNKTDNSYDVEHSFMSGTSVVIKHKVQLQRKSDGWKKWFTVDKEWYDNLENGDSVEIVDGVFKKIKIEKETE
jgi:uncharacterized protein YcfL